MTHGDESNNPNNKTKSNPKKREEQYEIGHMFSQYHVFGGALLLYLFILKGELTNTVLLYIVFV